MKCFFTSHKFKKIGRQAIGKTLERYMQCSKCNMFIIKIVIHPSYDRFYPMFDLFPKHIFFERKLKVKKHKK
jgi:hypothetical protein